MARKPILHGGKRDEIIEYAAQLFLEFGYEGTSIRMILNAVGGEVGMFYHYFNSKQELFDKVFAYFMEQQGIKLTKILEANVDTATPFQQLEQVIICFSQSMKSYKKLSNGNIHWSIISALHELTVHSLQPTVKDFIFKLCENSNIDISKELDWVTPYLLKGISGLLHEEYFLKLSQTQQYEIIIELICRTLKVPIRVF